MKAVIYARYSSDNQREESIEGQIRDCRAYAEYNGIDIVGEYIDRAFSAKTDDRPDFQRMVSDSSKKLFDVVLVWKLDRFARNRYDSAFYRYTLRKNGVKLISVKENISDGPEGIILESMIEGMAEYYSANLSQNVKRGFRENALKGKWNGGAIPFGYKVVDHKLAIDEESAPIVRLMFEMCADGKTAKEVYAYLKEKHVCRANGKPIGYTTVLYILGSRTYIGEYNHSGVVIENGVPAIISKDTFEKVQETLKKNSIAPAAHNEGNDYLLTTHLYCGKCGALMTAYSGTSQNGNVYRYYICNRTRKHECDKKKVEKDKIEDFVVAKTMEFLRKDEIIERLADLLYNLQYEENTLLPRLESQLAERTKEIDNIVTAIQKGVASDALLQRLNELEESKRSLADEIKKEQAERPLFTKDQFRMALYNFRKIDTTTKEGKAKLIDTFIDRIYLYDDYIKIIYNINGKDEEISLDELESSKGPQSGQSEDDFFSFASMPRNRELMRVFKDVGLVEHLGSGMSRILKEYDKSIFHISPRSIKVVFPFKEEQKVTSKVDSKVASKLNITQNRIVEIMRDNPQITISELSKIIGMSNSGIKKNIAKLKEDGVIERVGSDKSGSWKVK